MNPVSYKGNTLYTSDPYHDAADVTIEDLKIVSPLPMNGGFDNQSDNLKYLTVLPSI